MGEMPVLNKLQEVLIRLLPPDWIVEKSLTFSGVTPDLLLVHPERGVVLIGLSEFEAEFSFRDYDDSARRRLEGKEAAPVGAEDADLGNAVNWSGLGDPRELLLECRDELKSVYGNALERDVSKFLRTVFVVIQDAEPKMLSEVLGNVGSAKRKDVSVEWLRKSPVSMNDSELQSLVSRLVPQAYIADREMPDHIWTQIKRDVLGTEDAVMGMTPPPDFRFDVDQKRILEYIAAPGLKRFRGPAGSGKTLIIARAVADCISSGGRVLVVVRNKTMCQMISTRAKFFLNEGVSDLQLRIDNTRKFNSAAYIVHQERWWERVCIAANLNRERRTEYARILNNPDSEPDAAEYRIVKLAHSALNRLKGWNSREFQYDLVIADEAQNMFPENWDCLRLCTKSETGTAVIASDPTQSMYGQRNWTDQRMTGFGGNPWRKLKASYRLPPDYLRFVADFVHRFPPDDEVILPLEPDAPSLFGSTMYRVGLKSGYPKDAIVAAIEFAINILQFSPYQIAFIVPGNKRGEVVVKELHARNIEVTHTFNPELRHLFGKNDGVRGTTFHSFAGWESPCVIVDSGFTGKEENTNSLFYSGLTRLAKRDLGSALIVIESDNQYQGIIREYCKEVEY
jgi:hypothetical protein